MAQFDPSELENTNNYTNYNTGGGAVGGGDDEKTMTTTDMNLPYNEVS